METKGAMNMTLHGVEDPEIAYRDSLAEDHAEDAGAYSLVLANPPFAGSLDYETTAKDLLKIVKTKKTELLFVALFLRLLRTGGRVDQLVLVVEQQSLMGCIEIDGAERVVLYSAGQHEAQRTTDLVDHVLVAILDP